ncbi:MAG: glutathione S-transferase family protein [Alphaproteobacteria bacterium]|jgi:glutathione S-transferase|nr:glutathione S-transferase family protein [Alphaproteobacteria bacterium]MBT4019628.1 glutathione S-transferase family protein [Alphaproteobacteria bacterium]MBT4967103.1 glutathione S-transferase family protein [Alphaproteobacteria bacterium]MBT5161779.1 glutathione S-transferase family protein [Alphaproteobacteria bacterium]MBT5918853.1 glutathione S-transferase family protein [Alphaproteobacteria bacterium]
MIKLYDYILSGSCYKVRLMLNILNIEYEVVPVDFYPGLEHKKPEMLALNPLGQLPVMVDGDLVLRDAQSILVYLASKFDDSNSWFPDDAAARGQVAMWTAFGGGEIMAASAARLHDVLNYPFDIDQQRKSAHAAFVILDDHIAEQEIMGLDWLAGGAPTIADIACFPYVSLSEDGGISREEYPAIERWLRRFMDIPGFIDMPGVLQHWRN